MKTQENTATDRLNEVMNSSTDRVLTLAQAAKQRITHFRYEAIEQQLFDEDTLLRIIELDEALLRLAGRLEINFLADRIITLRYEKRVGIVMIDTVYLQALVNRTTLKKYGICYGNTASDMIFLTADGIERLISRLEE